MTPAASIAALAARLGTAALERACCLLESASSEASASEVLRIAAEDFAPWAAAELEAIATCVPNPSALALALRTAAVSDDLARARCGETEPVWSGPTVGSTGLRSIEQALRDVILSATSELWLVSFAAFRVAHLSDALKQTANRGTRLHFLLESADDSEGALTVDARAAFDPQLPVTFYTWPLENRARNALGRPGKLHAKFAVADAQTAIVSSANLTADALERNLECGVLIRGGPVPAKLAEQLARLVATGQIRVVTAT
ncbi:MAG: DISARM system phospholipase D-like protein DrmC [Chthoniobacteraceae bacterium]